MAATRVLIAVVLPAVGRVIPKAVTPRRATPFALGLLLIAGALPAVAAAASTEASERVALRQGVLCRASSEAMNEGETHACFFSPTKVGRHDFSSRNARAGYVVTELGPNCGEIEILGESEVPQDDGNSLRRVSVLCLK